MRNVCKGTNIKAELNHLQQAFQINGYPPQIVLKTLTKTRRPPEPTPPPEKMPKKLILSYVQGLSERIERLVRPLNIVTISTTQTIIRKKVMWVKWKPNKQENCGVVYRIPCECGTAYIRKTGQTLQAKIQEHKQAVWNSNMKNGIASDVMKKNHNILWEEANVIITETQWTRRKVKESHIIRTPNNMNL